jgi:hypothetical protein
MSENGGDQREDSFPKGLIESTEKDPHQAITSVAIPSRLPIVAAVARFSLRT